MRQKLITLDPTTFELASKKTNFSEWVRNTLRSERNRPQDHVHMPLREMSTERIQWELHRRDGFKSIIEDQNHDEAKTSGEEE